MRLEGSGAKVLILQDLGAGMARAVEGGMTTTYDVHEGRPSWHQQRAGHISAGVTTGFATREAAEAFVARCKGFRPTTSIFIVERKGQE